MNMLMGIDVGGTHTDAVAIDGSSVVASAKTPTDHDNLMRSILSALDIILAKVDPSRVSRMNLSTTLSTNAIVEGKAEDVGLLVSAGPGIDPDNHMVGRYYYELDGSIDHRGTEIRALDREQLSRAVEACRSRGVRVFAAVGKFSTRNPDHEKIMADRIGSDIDFITQGHRLSGTLNFPRRVATAYFNSAVWRIYNDFAWAVAESARDYGLTSEINILKADGGTLPLAASQEIPVETILSGPAASIMGIVALCDIREDSIILDIGGTTTDIAVFADGSPLIEKDGMTVGSYPTLVRAMNVRSIGIGGDSALHFSSGAVTAGPDRQGPPLALCNRPGQATPTLTDAMNFLGITRFGDCNASRAGILELAGKWRIDARELSERAVRYAIGRIHEAALDLVREINDKPVYTVHELLEGKVVQPGKVYVMGGPAEAFAERLAAAFRLEVVLPDHYRYANAIGAALTQATFEAELFADTKRGVSIIPNLGVYRAVGLSYNRKTAETDVVRSLREHLKNLGVDRDMGEPVITESESFNMVEGFNTTGRNIRVKCQIKPHVQQVLAKSANRYRF